MEAAGGVHVREVTAAPQAPAIPLNEVTGLGRQLRARMSCVPQRCLPLYTDYMSTYPNTGTHLRYGQY